MAHPFFSQPSFAAGEVAPGLYGRIDLESYGIGLRTCRNFIIRQYGGASNRPGTKFVCEAPDPATRFRLVNFNFNDQQSYALLFGDEIMRVIKGGAEVTEAAKTIVGVTLADPVVIEVTGHGYSNGDDVYLSGLGGTAELNGRTVRVANKTTDTFELVDYLGNTVNGTDMTAWTSGGTAARIYQISTPWTEDDLFDLDDNACINWAQSNDVLTVFLPSLAPADVTRSDHNAWTITDFSPSGGPFLDANGGAITIYSNAATGGVTLTASAALFSAGLVGSLIRLEQEPNDTVTAWEVGKSVSSGNIRRASGHYYEAASTGTTGTLRPDWIEGTYSDGGVLWTYLHSGFGIAEITSYSSSTSVGATVTSRLPASVVGSGNATTNWSLGAWSDVQGYPAAGAYHKQRFCAGGTTQRPNDLFFSNVGLRGEFGRSAPALDDESVTATLDTVQANAIRHLIPMSSLIALTSSSEQVVTGTNESILATEPLTAKVQGYTGASRVPPLMIGNIGIYVQSSGQEIRTIQYSLDSDSFTGIDLTARSPHLFAGKKVIDMAWARTPFSIALVVLDDGSLLTLTFMEEQKVYAWARHDTLNGAFETVCVIREDGQDAVYLGVRRTINGQTRRMVERLASRFLNSDVRNSYFVDCGLSYDGRNTATTTLTVTGGTTWGHEDALSVTASAAVFAATDIGSQIILNDGATAMRMTIEGYSSSTVVTARPVGVIPLVWRNGTGTDWEIARSVFRNLDHLEGQAVSVLSDGNVVRGLSVFLGAVTLPAPGAVVHIGLPYSGTLEPLDIVYPQGQGKAQTFNVPRVFTTVEETRGLKISSAGAGFLTEAVLRDHDSGYDTVGLFTGQIETITSGRWSNRGRILIQQDDPLPVTVTCITPEVAYGKS